MGFGGLLKGLAKGVGSAVGRPVRGIGRIMRGNFREGIGDLGHGLKRGAQVAALLGSGGAAAPLLAAGGGMLERATDDNASFRNVVGAGVSGASGALAARGVGNIGRSMLNRGADSVAGQAASSGLNRGAESVVSQAASTASPAYGQYVEGAHKAAGGVTEAGGIGGFLSRSANFLEEHPTSVTFAGNLLSGTGYDQGDYYRDIVRQRRDEEEYERSQEKMLRDMIVSGAWRSR